MVVIITGSTGGIGRCVAECAVKSSEVDKVYCMYRNEQKLNQWKYAGHPKVIPVWHDGCDPGEYTKLLQVLDDLQPDRIAYIHTAFQILPIKRIGTYLADEARENISVNVLDMVLLANQLLQFAKDHKAQLRMIHIDSGAADRPLEGWGLYAAAKAYANLFFRTVQLENPDVKVVAYEPGVVDTPMQEEIRKTDQSICGQAEQFRDYYHMGMLRSPDAVAGDLFERFVEGWDAKQFRERYQGC